MKKKNIEKINRQINAIIGENEMDEKKYEENLKLENSSSYKIESLNKFNDMVDEHKEYGK